MFKQVIFNEGGVREFREITVTSKRQITIPKSFFDRLAIEETLVAYLTDEGIFLKPVRDSKNNSRSIAERDLKELVHRVIAEGYEGEELAEEIAYRISEYHKQVDRRIQEFENDLNSDSVSEEVEDEEFNGLNVFFDTETGEAAR